jgi:hypothetical protein
VEAAGTHLSENKAAAGRSVPVFLGAKNWISGFFGAKIGSSFLLKIRSAGFWSEKLDQRVFWRENWIS